MDTRNVHNKEILPGVRLERSTTGGFSVTVEGEYVGWVHASVGDFWNAFLRQPGEPGRPLGKFKGIVRAVRAIVNAAVKDGRLPAEWAAGDSNPEPED